MPLRGFSPQPSAPVLRSRLLHDIVYTIEDAIQALYIHEAHIYIMYARSSEQIDRAHEILSEVEALPPSSRHVCASIVGRARMLEEETRDSMRRLAIELGDIVIGRRTLEQVLPRLERMMPLEEDRW